jgi:integrase
LIPELAAVLEPLRGGGGRVFCYDDGSPIENFSYTWKKACRAAGIGARLFHDFRRTAARRLIRSGIPEVTAMAMLGHKTRHIFERYAITDETILKEAGAKLMAQLASEAPVVVSMTPGRVAKLAKLHAAEKPEPEPSNVIQFPVRQSA